VGLGRGYAIGLAEAGLEIMVAGIVPARANAEAIRWTARLRGAAALQAVAVTMCELRVNGVFHSSDVEENTRDAGDLQCNLCRDGQMRPFTPEP
jgi:hypothetical protein